MTKYLVKGAAALTLALAAVSCSNNADLAMSLEEQKTAQYEAAFVQAFGKIDKNQDWGFGSTTKGLTRSITVNGDVYSVFNFPTADELAAAFPTSIPTDAVEITEKSGDDYSFWGGGKNYKITNAGTYKNIGSSFYNYGNPYNVYIEVDGDVTLTHGTGWGYNLYVLKGNVTLDNNSKERAGIISVAEGATVSEPRSSIADNAYVKIYNRGTFNVTNTNGCDLGNNCSVYNEGTFAVTGDLTYSPGSGNTSYFVNMGDDAVLTAPSMTLNSTCHFYNSGITTIEGETNVTQANIYWINNGHYTTGSMIFSAKNATFYNYCQLLVTGNAHMYDGEFNLMDGSYTEAATADFDNFIVNMGNNSGFNVKGNNDWAGQGDGTYQGFKATGDNAYVRLGGTTTVAEHMLSLELTGKVTYAINNLVDLGASNSGVQPTYRFNAGTTEVPFANLTATPDENGCGAAWKVGTTTTPAGGELIASGRIFCEDMGSIGDFDFNDVVFDAYLYEDKTVITLLAAGGTLPISVAGQDVHALLGAGMVNTGDGPTSEPKTFTVNQTYNNLIDIPVVVSFGEDADDIVTLKSVAGEAPQKLCLPVGTKWAKEYIRIDDVYAGFSLWVENANNTPAWDAPTTGLFYGE